MKSVHIRCASNIMKKRDDSDKLKLDTVDEEQI